MSEESKNARARRALKKPSEQLASELHKAVWYGRPEDLRSMLLAESVDPDYRPSRGGSTLLAKAAMRASASCLPVLLEAGANVHALDDHGRNVLFHLLSSQDSDAQDRRVVFDGLMAAGVNLHVVDRHGQTAMHWAAGGSPELVAVLLSQGLDPDACDHDETTPLFEAVRSNASENVRILLAAGAAVDAQDWERIRPLHLAANVDAVECMELLLAAGADPNLPGRGGETPLMRAAKYDRARGIELLIAAGADVAAKNKQGITALDIAFEERKEDACLVILAGGKFDQVTLDAMLVSATRKGMARMVTKLCEAGADTAQRVNGKPLSSLARADDVRRALRAEKTARAVSAAMQSDAAPAEMVSRGPTVL